MTTQNMSLLALLGDYGLWDLQLRHHASAQAKHQKRFKVPTSVRTLRLKATAEHTCDSKVEDKDIGHNLQNNGKSERSNENNQQNIRTNENQNAKKKKKNIIHINSTVKKNNWS